MKRKTRQSNRLERGGDGGGGFFMVEKETVMKVEVGAAAIASCKLLPFLSLLCLLTFCLPFLIWFGYTQQIRVFFLFK
jgi:hypothetical protein